MRGCWSCDSPGVCNTGGNSDVGPNPSTFGISGAAGIDAPDSSRGDTGGKTGGVAGSGICFGTSRTLTLNGGFLPKSASI
ncbi:hypothetical protein OKW31_000949 [Paraburkholderia atlantica]